MDSFDRSTIRTDCCKKRANLNFHKVWAVLQISNMFEWSCWRLSMLSDDQEFVIKTTTRWHMCVLLQLPSHWEQENKNSESMYDFHVSINYVVLIQIVTFAFILFLTKARRRAESLFTAVLHWFSSWNYKRINNTTVQPFLRLYRSRQ